MSFSCIHSSGRLFLTLTLINKDLATRILAAWYLLGQDSGYPDVNFNAWTGGGSHVNVQGDHATYDILRSPLSRIILKSLYALQSHPPNRRCICCTLKKHQQCTTAERTEEHCDHWVRRGAVLER